MASTWRMCESRSSLLRNISITFYTLLIIIGVVSAGYDIAIVTSSQHEANSHGELYVQIYGLSGSNSNWLKISPENDFLPGSPEFFYFADDVVPDLGTLYKIRLILREFSKSWHLTKIVIRDTYRPGVKFHEFLCNCQLDGQGQELFCPVDGGWTEWSPWLPCVGDCKRGPSKQMRSRSCTHPQPQRGGDRCAGQRWEEKTCSPVVCLVTDGVWGPWSSWTRCSQKCNGGKQTSERACRTNCTGPKTRSRACNQHNCTSVGDWTIWGNWGECSATCGGGAQYKFKECVGGSTCTGKGVENRTCNTMLCPVKGGWSTWGTWDKCTKPCGGGAMLRSRSCSQPVGGIPCHGVRRQSRLCNTHPCERLTTTAVKGGWSTWGMWDKCTKPCGGGAMLRSRSCSLPVGGIPCHGVRRQSRLCNTLPCERLTTTAGTSHQPQGGQEGVWSNWTTWSSCSASCGQGVQSKSRVCFHPAGVECNGSEIESRSCVIQECVTVLTGKQKQEETKASSGTVVGLSVAIPLVGVVIMVLLGVCIYTRKRQKTRTAASPVVVLPDLPVAAGATYVNEVYQHFANGNTATNEDKPFKGDANELTNEQNEYAEVISQKSDTNDKDGDYERVKD